MNEEIKLVVAQARSRDDNRNIVRVNEDTMNSIEIYTGDIIEISGNRTTCCVAWPAYPEDQEKKIIRLNKWTMTNAKVEVGKEVSIRKAFTKNANTVVLEPINMKLKEDNYLERFIQSKLINYPIIEGDIVLVTIGLNKEIIFRVKKTLPKGILVISTNTNINIINKKQLYLNSDDDLNNYENLGGLNDKIRELREIIEIPINHPEIYDYLNIRKFKGILLYGPSGCGKTSLIKSIVDQTAVNFISLNFLDIFGKYAEEFEKKLIDIFREAVNNQPTIIHIPNIDLLAPNNPNNILVPEKRVISLILELIDKIDPKYTIFLIGETNDINAVNPSLLQPGKFDILINIDRPDEKKRLEILKNLTKNEFLYDKIDFHELARMTEGFTGASLKLMIDNAKLNAIKRNFSNILDIQEEISLDRLNGLKIISDDFNISLKKIKELMALNNSTEK
ncbi:MAG: AAA family ATPase [Candidatus Helarchaeota archaeon]